jgi:hypothetical protein
MMSKSAKTIIFILAIAGSLIATPDYLPTMRAKLTGEKKIVKVINKKQTEFTYECHEGRRLTNCQEIKREIVFLDNQQSPNEYSLEVSDIAYDQMKVNDFVEVNITMADSENFFVLSSFLGNKSELQFYLLLIFSICFIAMGFVFKNSEKWIKENFSSLFKKNQ